MATLENIAQAFTKNPPHLMWSQDCVAKTNGKRIQIKEDEWMASFFNLRQAVK